MPIRNRIFFFDPINLDRFNSRDIPTEQTMLDWSDSVTFIKEVDDRSQLSRAGIAKTTTDHKVNNLNDTDISGVSPYGFTTFVRPSQLPVLLNSASITWSRVPRSAVTNTDTGVGILDWQGTVAFPAIVIPENTDDIVTTVEYEVFLKDGTPCSMNTVSTILPIGSTVTAVLDKLVESVNKLNDLMGGVSSLACEGAVDVGDTLMTLFPSNTWSARWLEPNGASLSTVLYPELFGKIGYTYGGAATSFNLPNLTTGNPFIRLQAGPAAAYLSTLLAGSNNVSLNNSNIPLHTHTFSGNTNSDGTHTHSLPARSTNGTANSARRGDASDSTWSFGGDGAHSHAFSGTTNGYGQNPVASFSIIPEHKRVYLKMKVL